jgi:hypothetical protein
LSQGRLVTGTGRIANKHTSRNRNIGCHYPLVSNQLRSNWQLTSQQVNLCQIFSPVYERNLLGRACPVSGSISVVNDLTGTHPIETRIPTSLDEAPNRLYFRAGNLPTTRNRDAHCLIGSLFPTIALLKWKSFESNKKFVTTRLHRPLQPESSRLQIS